MTQPHTKKLKEMLIEEFGTSEVTEATHPFEISINFENIAKGRRLSGRRCAWREGAMCQKGVNGAVVTECFSYLRFDGSREVFKFWNPPPMQDSICQFDVDQYAEPDSFILEPPKGALSAKYLRDRKEAIKN